MKYFVFIIATLFIFGCGNNEVIEEAPSNWLIFKANSDISKNKKIVLISGDEEYRSEEALPMLATILSERHGFDCTVLFAQDPDTLGIVNPNFTKNIEGLAALEDADLMILFTRFRGLPNEQMAYVENYLKAGKPLVGIRTATHAFHFKGDTTHSYYHWDNYYNGEREDWHGGFGKKILGANWYWHHGHHKHQSTRGVFAEANHAILKGIEDGAIWGSTDVYGMPLPLPDDAQPIVLGQVIARDGEYDGEDIFFGMRETDNRLADTSHSKKYHPNEPLMPIVWSKPYQLDENSPKGQTITSTIGASSDMLDEEVRRLFVNASYYLLGLEVPKSANVELVGQYQPTQYSFHSDEYWREKAYRISK